MGAQVSAAPHSNKRLIFSCKRLAVSSGYPGSEPSQAYLSCSHVFTWEGCTATLTGWVLLHRPDSWLPQQQWERAPAVLGVSQLTPLTLKKRALHKGVDPEKVVTRRLSRGTWSSEPNKPFAPKVPLHCVLSQLQEQAKTCKTFKGKGNDR